MQQRGAASSRTTEAFVKELGVGDGELGIHELVGQEFEAFKCGSETIGGAGEGDMLDSACNSTVAGDDWATRFKQHCREFGLEGQEGTQVPMARSGHEWRSTCLFDGCCFGGLHVSIAHRHGRAR